MPQMSPIMWTLILMTTTMTMIQMNSMNFFESTKMKQKLNFKKKKKINYWKW